MMSTRGDILRGMMHRPEMARLIKDAFNSPLGSTARAKTKKTFSIMQKLSASNDGMGGPGMSGVPESTPTMSPVASSTPKNMVIFRKIPTPRINYGNQGFAIQQLNNLNTGVPDGMGGPGGLDQFKIQGTGTPTPAAPSRSSLSPDMLKLFATPFGTASSSPFVGLKLPPPSAGSKFRLTGRSPVEGIGLGVIPRLNPNIATTPTSYTPPSSRLTVGLPGAPVMSPAWQKYISGAINLTKLNMGLPVSPETALPGMLVSSASGTASKGFPKVPYVPYTPSQSNITANITVPSAGSGLQSRVGEPPAQVLAPSQPTGGASDSWAANWAKANQSVTTGPGTQSTPQSSSSAFIAPTASAAPISAPIDTTRSFAPPTGATRGYGGEIAPDLAHRPLESLTLTERQLLRDVQEKREGSTLPNNPFGIKQGGATQHWLDEGKAVLGSTSSEPGSTPFLVFKDKATADAAYDALLYDSGVYAGKTVDQAMKLWSNYDDGTGKGPGTYAGLTGAVQAFDPSTGAGVFALQQNPLLGGSALEKSVWDKYKIGTLQDDVTRMKREQAELPANIAGYIRDRDTFIQNTDKAIDDYIKTMTTHNDMSDPLVKAEMNSHLNYLYTLRGRQNQQYIGYMNNAVNQHQAQLDSAIDDLTINMAAYEREVNTGQADYNTMSAALADMWTTIDGTPAKALQTELLQAQIYKAYADAAADSTTLNAKNGLIEWGSKLKGLVVDGDNYVLPGIDLTQKMGQLPEVPVQVIFDSYTNGVQNYLNAPENKDEFDGKGITPARKQKVAEDAIQQLVYVAAANASDPTGKGGRPETYKAAYIAAQDVASYVGDQMATKAVASGQVPQIMEAVNTLAPKGWFGGAKAPPSEEQFIATVAGEGEEKDSLQESIARAIYAVFLRMQAEGSSPEAIKNGLLYPSSSTDVWTDTSPFDFSRPFTPEEFAQNIGNLYALSVMGKAGL